jgi:hypothetical protein
VRPQPKPCLRQGLRRASRLPSPLPGGLTIDNPTLEASRQLEASRRREERRGSAYDASVNVGARVGGHWLNVCHVKGEHRAAIYSIDVAPDTRTIATGPSVTKGSLHAPYMTWVSYVRAWAGNAIALARDECMLSKRSQDRSITLTHRAPSLGMICRGGGRLHPGLRGGGERRGGARGGDAHV